MRSVALSILALVPLLAETASGLVIHMDQRDAPAPVRHTRRGGRQCKPRPQQNNVTPNQGAQNNGAAPTDASSAISSASAVSSSSAAPPPAADVSTSTDPAQPSQSESASPSSDAAASSAAPSAAASEAAPPPDNNSNNSTGGGISGTFSGGWASFYDVTTGPGNCGTRADFNAHTVAVSKWQMYNTYPGYDDQHDLATGLCGRKIEIHWQGKTVQAEIRDSCPPCGHNDIDLSHSAMAAFFDGDFNKATEVGKLFDITWSFI